MKTEGVKTDINRSIMINSLAGKCPFPAPNGHHHESSINVFSVFGTFWRHPVRMYERSAVTHEKLVGQSDLAHI